ncbi:hypothetical protein [Candidatus Magnetobacterium casense]|uniref:Uncharacterized protein n=1 Tax=Candidatus Magnetobacterium casense TaxID=1455061 RepID=A0ABS6S2Y3_9BACT|nr:hypothetical protein [Candidatus Magnetobacterium casensis]MBV6342997.1 hypothetical protein [Candidatus Magnetobacterium casensis]
MPSPKLTGGDKHIIRNIVGRLHVGTSDEEVINYLYSRFVSNPSPALAKAAAKYAIKAHHDNQDLYRRVQRGW